MVLSGASGWFVLGWKVCVRNEFGLFGALVLTREEDVDAHALRRQGWSISAIARHLGRDRKTIRSYLNGERVPEHRAQLADAFVPFMDYCRQRLADETHLWASALFDEVCELGYRGAYSTFTRALRRHQVRPHCEPCKAATGRDVAVIAHPPAEDFPHLVQALDRVVRKLGGTARRWRFDRMATVCHPPSGRVLPAFAAVAKYYGVGVDICPPRRGNRKGVVEKANHSAAQRWWRTVPDALSVEQAQSGVDKLAARMDERRRRIDGASATVAELAAAEPLLEVPTRPFPADLEVERTASPQGLVSFDGNQYSVPPGLPGAQVKVLHRLGEDYLHVLTAGRAVVAKHRRAPGGSGQVVRDAGHVIALERAVLASFSDRAPCKSKVRRPPSEAALAGAERLRGTGTSGSATAERVVIDLSHSAAVVDRLRTAPTPEEDHGE